MSRAPAEQDIVLVDDDEIVHLFVQRQLRRSTLSLTAFTDPEQALEWLGTHRPSLLLLDHRMPRLDGLTLLDRLGGPARAADRVVLCSADHNDPGIRRLVGEPALTVLNKAELLDRRRFLAALGLAEPAFQCAETASAPDSSRASSTLPSTNADGR